MNRECRAGGARDRRSGAASQLALYRFIVKIQRVFYSHDEAAELLAVSKHFIRNRVEDGTLEQIRVSGPKITVESILAFLRKQGSFVSFSTVDLELGKKSKPRIALIFVLTNPKNYKTFVNLE